ncbi:recombinase family protein [Gordonia sp. NPDC003422]
MSDTATVTPYVLGYARVSTTHQSLDQQTDALTEAGVPADRIYSDKLTGSTMSRPGLAALLAAAREGDVIVVAGIDRLGRSAAEVMSTIKDLLEKGIIIKSLREGVDSSTAVGRAVFGVMASMAELELELGRERRAAAREARAERGLPTGRPAALDDGKVATLRRMHAAGEPTGVLAETFGISRRTVQRLVRGD